MLTTVGKICVKSHTTVHENGCSSQIARVITGKIDQDFSNFDWVAHASEWNFLGQIG